MDALEKLGYEKSISEDVDIKNTDNRLYLKSFELAEQLIKEMPNELKIMLEVE